MSTPYLSRSQSLADTSSARHLLSSTDTGGRACGRDVREMEPGAACWRVMGWRCWDSSFPLFPSSSLLLPPPPYLLLPPFFPLPPSFYPLPPHPLPSCPPRGDTKGSSSPKKIKPGRAEAGTEPFPRPAPLALHPATSRYQLFAVSPRRSSFPPLLPPAANRPQSSQ